MPLWDVRRNDRDEELGGLTPEQIREALAEGRLVESDLVRPAGLNTKWVPLSRVPSLARPKDAETLPAPAPPPSRPPEAPRSIFDDDDSTTPTPTPTPGPDDSAVAVPLDLPRRESAPPLAGIPSTSQPPADLHEDLAPPPIDHDHLNEDEEAVEGALVRRPKEKLEEIDLTAMVDVAFQLILFFLVTATSIFFKSLEIPNPDPEKPENAVQAPQLDDLEDTNILVEIDARGQITVDHEPIAPTALVPKLRASREQTGRVSMILMGDPAAKHKVAVQVIEAARELGITARLARLSGGEFPEG